MVSLPIGALRSVSEGAMTSTLEITRSGLPLDENGEVVRDAYGDPYSSEPSTTTTRCKLRSTSGDESVIAGQLQESAEALIKAPVDTDVRSSDEVYVDGVKFNVKSVGLRSRGQAADLKVQVSRSSS